MYSSTTFSSNNHPDIIDRLIMPVPTIESPAVSHLESTHPLRAIRAMDTPVKPIPEANNVITPETMMGTSFSSGNDTSSSESVSTSDTDELENVQSNLKTLSISDHKRLELEGKHKPEPMLDENAGRFVLFPIQHPDVSLNSPPEYHPYTFYLI